VKKKLRAKKTCFVSCHFEPFSVKIGQKFTSLRKKQTGESFWRCTVCFELIDKQKKIPNFFFSKFFKVGGNFKMLGDMLESFT